MTIAKDDLKGLFPALVTPFDMTGKLCAETTGRLVDRMIGGGASGLVPIGGTGEYSALSPAERSEFTAMTVRATQGRVPVVAGVVATGFADAVEAGNSLKAAGADAIMLVTPYYAVGSQEGVRAYFGNYREAVDLPLLLYEIPGRTNVSMKAETISAIAEDGSIIGMKYSSYDMPEFIRVIKQVGQKIAVLSGEEPLFASHVSLGAAGGVIATANLVPGLWKRIFDLSSSGDLTAAIDLQHKMSPLLDAVFAEMNPGPLKHAMALSGMDVGDARLPLLPPSAETQTKLAAALLEVQPLEDALLSIAA